MYFPFMRGKQYEFLTILSIKNLINKNKNVFPIIEPIKISKLNIGYIQKINKANIPLIIIVNPLVGSLIGKEKLIKEEIIDGLGNNNFYVAYQVTNDTTEDKLNEFKKIYNGFKKCFIHQNMYGKVEAFCKDFSKNDEVIFNIVNNKLASNNYKKIIQKSFEKVVVLDDGFKKEKRNADYPEVSYFSDLMFNYKTSGFYGYSDYITIGEKYDDSGSTPYAIVIHYSVVQASYMNINHYLSDRKSDQKDPAGKFLEALSKLKIDVDKNKYIKTDATKEFLNLYNIRHYPGLGKIKEISMKHHIQLVSEVI